jgi:hypothetical protein
MAFCEADEPESEPAHDGIQDFHASSRRPSGLRKLGMDVILSRPPHLSTAQDEVAGQRTKDQNRLAYVR